MSAVQAAVRGAAGNGDRSDLQMEAASGDGSA
jgi:hypothetical protein